MSWLRMAAGFVMAGWACFSTLSASTLRLREQVEVQGQTIRLRDLMTCDSDLPVSAENLEFGGAPQLGSTRMLLHDQILRRLAGNPELRDMEVPQRILVTRKGWTIDRDTVSNAVAGYLRDRGWKEEQMPAAKALKWAEGIRSAEATAALRITRADWSAVRHMLQFRVQCAQRSACGSFLVEVEVPDSAGLRSAGSVNAEKTGKKVLAPGTASKAKAPILVAAGRRAMLLFESAGMRISLPVLALGRGGLGERVRVREWHGPRVYVGEVVGAGLLRASL